LIDANLDGRHGYIKSGAALTKGNHKGMKSMKIERIHDALIADKSECHRMEMYLENNFPDIRKTTVALFPSHYRRVGILFKVGVYPVIRITPHTSGSYDVEMMTTSKGEWSEIASDVTLDNALNKAYTWILRFLYFID